MKWFTLVFGSAFLFALCLANDFEGYRFRRFSPASTVHPSTWERARNNGYLNYDQPSSYPQVGGGWDRNQNQYGRGRSGGSGGRGYRTGVDGGLAYKNGGYGEGSSYGR